MNALQRLVLFSRLGEPAEPPEPGSATHFAVEIDEASQTAGLAFNFSVTALDENELVDETYAGTVTFDATNPEFSSLPDDTTLTAGTGSFQAIQKVKGLCDLTATDTVSPSITGSDGITILHDVPYEILVAASTPQTQWEQFGFLVSVVDQFANICDTYDGAVDFESDADDDAVFAGEGPYAVAGGSDTFHVTFKVAGDFTITATDTVTGSITGTSDEIVIEPEEEESGFAGVPGQAFEGSVFI